MLPIRASPEDPVVSHLPARSTPCICNKREQWSSKCYATLCIFLLWLHSATELQKWSAYVILLSLGRRVVSDPEPRRDQFCTGCRKLSTFPSSRKEKHGDRFSSGEWFWTRKRGSQRGVVGYHFPERILEKLHECMITQQLRTGPHMLFLKLSSRVRRIMVK